MACLFDRFRHHSLVFGTVTGIPAGADLSLIIDKTFDHILLLIINLQGFVGAELANAWASSKMAAVISTGSPLFGLLIVPAFVCFSQCISLRDNIFQMVPPDLPLQTGEDRYSTSPSAPSSIRTDSGVCGGSGA